MKINKEQFEQLVGEVIDDLPEKFKNKLYNVAIFVEYYPTKEQIGKPNSKSQYTLFGLFEGYAQAKRLDFGPVLPDKITIFRQPICEYCNNEQEVKQKIISTVKHEIAHHFGSEENGARKASR